MSPQLNVALIGQQFMGRAHSNAWTQANKFIGGPSEACLHTIAARDPRSLKSFASRFGWQNWTTDWRELAANDEIDLVDVGTPNHVHMEQSLAMLEAGKHVACEKPLAGTLDDARAMRDAARRRKKLKTFVWFNYRRCPAVALMHKLVQSGKIGKVISFRATYLQSWGGPDVPLLWRFQKKYAGSGAHGDLNAHLIDMIRFVLQDEMAEINGAIAKTFVKERKKLGGARKGLGGSSKKGSATGKVDVDDAVLFITTMKGGAMGSVEATRNAVGHQNRNTLEVNGERGSIAFDFESMNILRYCDASDAASVHGWREIMCTSAGNHPYAEYWWPDAHIIGYEHTFTNLAGDIIKCLSGKKVPVPMPDFADAYETQRVLEAAMVSAKERCAVKLSEVK